MNKRPIIWRTVFAVIVITVFACSIFPLHRRDFYETFESMLSLKFEKDQKLIDSLIEKAREKQVANKDIFPSTALEQAADEKGIDLTEFIKTKGVIDNRDVISVVRKNASSSIRLGLDLNGGVEFLLELEPDQALLNKINNETEDKKSFDREFDRYRDIAIEVLRNRLEEEKIFESEISPAGGKYISLKVPIVSKDERVKLGNLIKRAAKLKFCLVSKKNNELVEKYRADPENFRAPVGFKKMEATETGKGKKSVKRIYFVRRRPEMTGKNVVDAFPTTDEFGQRKIILKFNREGAKRFGEVTSGNVDRLLAIVLDGKLYSAPSIRQAIYGGNAEISGRFSREEAQSVANALKSGSLPVKIKVAAVFDTDPTLGRESVQNGIYAGIIALVAVMLFMLVYYLRAGIAANIALLVNIVLVLGALAAFEATLTLPGIAGIILTIGMAVDANVLIYERIREELSKNKGLAHAIDAGYRRAFTTILDANLTTLFTALILTWVGSGAVKGFGVTLSIGIVTSMFTALFLTRLIFDIMARFMSSQTIKMLQFFKQPEFDFLKIRKITGTCSVLLIILSIVFFVFKGREILGVDFTGGTQIMFSYDKYVPRNDIALTLEKAGFEKPRITYKTSAVSVSDNKKLEILIREISVDKAGGQVESPKTRIAEILNKKYPGSNFHGGQETSLGGLIGWEFSKAAATAMLLALLGIVIYISIRFEFAFAIASIIALVHDVIISTGIFIVTGNELSLPVVAALLTIIGYSLNDTIVVFDRIREDITYEKGKSYIEIINLSINQTLSRTILTSLTTLLVLLVLFFMGGIAVKDFVFVMLIGVIVGTYSSIFVASPIVAVWHKKIGSSLKEKAYQKSAENAGAKA
jgi:SecD/SecF fusion protein